MFLEGKLYRKMKLKYKKPLEKDHILHTSTKSDARQAQQHLNPKFLKQRGKQHHEHLLKEKETEDDAGKNKTREEPEIINETTSEWHNLQYL